MTVLLPFANTLYPMSNISPVTYRDGTTLIRQLEDLKTRINETLIPDINANLSANENAILATAADWLSRWDGFMTNIQAELAARNDAAIGDLITDTGTDTYAAFIALIDQVAVTAAELATTLGGYATTTALAAKLDNTAKGTANGVASLGADGKVPAGQLPAAPPTNLAGYYSTRPAANSVAAGTVYYATDVQETYRSTGLAWATVGTGGNELGYAATSGVPMTSTTSTTGVPVAGLSISFTAGTRPVDIDLECQLANGVQGYTAYAVILLDGVVKRNLPHFSPAVDVWNMVRGSARIGGLTPGQTYVATVQVKTDAPGTARFGSDANLTVVNR